MEAALRTAEDRYQLAVDAARLPVWEYDVDGDTVIGNLYWHQVLGHDVTEAEAARRVETWRSNIHPDDVGRLSQVFSGRSEEHTSELQSQSNLVCRLLLE